ncbi:hypothetical protein GHA01_11310 [Novacetimonas hansenii]|uniref:Uncharacterized protein n=1 Tax=Novacetimonas hansenii TaxID=436 RepID=A0ABQ0SDU8_NOVHA|nr:hypothetical protein Gaha_0188_013 [Novacetimonas hansenii JCM 7643]GBQ52822.1 hypothetical protein AA0243_0156 [Novacetimonas hansenii NRIC 0243]GEC63282.1 hypothetical protein GHA01_11310 [Novacetimonas hansenii]
MPDGADNAGGRVCGDGLFKQVVNFRHVSCRTLSVAGARTCAECGCRRGKQQGMAAAQMSRGRECVHGAGGPLVNGYGKI